MLPRGAYHAYAVTSGEQPEQLQEPSVTFTGGSWHFDQVLSDTELEDGIDLCDTAGRDISYVRGLTRRR